VRYFDYEKVAHEANIAAGDLDRLCRIIRREFPTDEMMYELHVSRACMAVKQGRAALPKSTESVPVPTA